MVKKAVIFHGTQGSPDGNWFLVKYLPFNRWNSDIGLVSADGKELINLTESGYECNSPKWMMEGEAIVWFSGRNGMKSHGSWGSQSDAYAMFLTKSAYDKFKLSNHKDSTKKQHCSFLFKVKEYFIITCKHTF